MNPEGARALPTTSQFVASVTPTPLVPIRIGDAAPPVWCKLEFINPSGSTKDRVAAHILLRAHREGALRPDSTVVEASSGSTSIAMALVCAQLGVRFVAVMPEGVSNERAQLIQAYGGEVERVGKDAGMERCIARAREVARDCDGFLPDQFANPENANAHRFGTAREILAQIPGGVVDGVVAGVGTGGTLAGVTRGLKDAGCSPRMFAAKPLMLVRSGACGCSGAMHCFCDAECSSFSSRIPGVVDNMSRLFSAEERDSLDIVEVEDSFALDVTKRLHHLGFPVGPSSGLNVAAALQVGEQLGSESTVVTVLPDRIERYFSTGLLEDDTSTEAKSSAGDSCCGEEHAGAKEAADR